MIKISADVVHESLRKMEEEISSSEPIQRFIKASSDVKIYTAALREELEKRGFKTMSEVQDDEVVLEILDAVGPMPVIK